MNNPPSPPPIQEWFNNVQVAPPEEPKQPRNKKRIAIIIGGSIMGVFLVLGIVAALTSPSDQTANSNQNCLGGNDYKALTGELPSDALDAKEPFYDYPVTFVSDSTTFADEDPSNEIGLQEIGIFYQQRSAIPMTFTLIATRLDGDSEDLSQQRLDRITQILTQAGVPSDTIETDVTVAPTSSTSDGEDRDAEANEVDTDIITVRVTSPNICENQ